MTDEQIFATAHATGMMLISLGLDKQKVEFSILAFAKQIAKLEREACAKVCDGYIGADPIAAAIRARGEA
jgi:hypothetical protein